MLRSFLINILVAYCLFGCSLTDKTLSHSDLTVNSTLSMAQLMEWVIDPAADGIWESVSWVSSIKGDKEIYPKTEADWDKLRNSAATLMESTQLLMLPGRARDNQDWMRAVLRLRKTVENTMVSIKARDIDAIFEAGSHIHTACEACHLKYAYFEQKSPTTPSSR